MWPTCSLKCMRCFTQTAVCTTLIVLEDRGAVIPLFPLHCLLFFWPFGCAEHIQPISQCSFFQRTWCPFIFILTVGANLLCGEWSIGIGELHSLPRQTVILRQTPAHPGPSLHLSDLKHCFRSPSSSSSSPLPPPSFALFGEKDDASLNLITISKISHKIIPHGLASGWWQRARRSLIPNVSRSYDTGRQSDVLLPSSQTQGQVFLTRLQSCSKQ